MLVMGHEHLVVATGHEHLVEVMGQASNGRDGCISGNRSRSMYGN